MSSPQLPTPKRILVETLRLMETRRGEGVRVEDIAKAAGVSRQAVYLHFTSRAGLLKAALDYVEETMRLEERLLPVFGKSGAAGIAALVEFWGAFVADTYGISKAFVIARTTDPDAAAAWAAKMTALYDGCRAIMACSQRDGVLAADWSVTEAADFLWAMLTVEQWEHLRLERGWSQAQYIERLTRVLIQALVTDSAT